MTEAEIYDELQAILTVVSGLTVIRDNQNADRPTNAYGMLNLINSFESGEVACRTWTREGVVPNETVTEFIGRQWTWVFSVNFYDKYPTNHCRKVMDRLLREDNPIYPAVVDRVSLIRRLPELINERWEPRANFDVTLSSIVSDGVVIDAIDEGTVIISGKPESFRPDTATPETCEEIATAVYKR